jgi:hypothetical protein
MARWPRGVKRKMSYLNRLIVADQGGDDHDAAVAWI